MWWCKCECEKHVCKFKDDCSLHCKCCYVHDACDPNCQCRSYLKHIDCRHHVPKTLKQILTVKVFESKQDLTELPITLQSYVYGTLCFCSQTTPNRYIHVECLRYSLSTGIPLRWRTLKSVACLRYAVEKCGLNLDASFYLDMCYYGNQFDMFKYAHEKGVAWSKHVCTVAACEGKYDLLVYAHQNGCPWITELPSRIVNSGHADCLTYAHDHMQDCSPFVLKNLPFFLYRAWSARKLKTAFILLVRIVWKKCTMSWF